MDINLFKTLSKYPFIADGHFYDSVELSQNKTCVEKCKEKDCILNFQKNNVKGDYTCSKGYNNVGLQIGKLTVILNGLIFTDNQLVPNGRKQVRTNWIVQKEAVNLFINKIKEIESHIVSEINKATEQNFSMFHDFKTSMTIFFNCTQDIIAKLPGTTFEEKLTNSESSYKDLYNSLELITSQLGMVDVILNPQSIEFGIKKRINIYRLFEKIKILFGHLSTKKRDVNIKLISEGWIEDCSCYDSIEFIPLILLDNALKYSVADSDIEIKFEQHRKNIKVMVKNIGPFVNDENRSKIFEKFFRDEAGKAFSKEGVGMGLWIAQEVLTAHDSKLNYYRDPKETRPIGLNVFEFDLPTI